MFKFKHYVHEVISTPDGMVLIDVVNIPGCGWEGAYSRFNEKVFGEKWYVDSNEPYDMKDIIDWGEEMEAFDDWIVVSSHHRNPEIALQNIMKELKKAS